MQKGTQRGSGVWRAARPCSERLERHIDFWVRWTPSRPVIGLVKSVSLKPVWKAKNRPTQSLAYRASACHMNRSRGLAVRVDNAGVAQLVESQLPKLVVASSTLVARSKYCFGQTMGNKMVQIILVILLSPIAVFLKVSTGKHLIIKVVLCISRYAPGIIQAYWLMFRDK